jgi:hypothetical protein
LKRREFFWRKMNNDIAPQQRAVRFKAEIAEAKRDL